MEILGNRGHCNFAQDPNAREVKISILFTRIGEIDTKNEKFSCDATLFITWYEKANVLEKCDSECDNSYLWNSKNLWDPQLYIDNAINDVKEKDVKICFEKFYDDLKKEWYLEVHMVKRIQGTFFQKLELIHFPFDVQDLSITVTSHRTMDEIILVQDDRILPRIKSASLDKHIWKLHGHVNVKMHTIQNDFVPETEIETSCTNSAITMQSRVSRRPGYFILYCLFPTLMIMLCTFFSFLLDFDQISSRFSLLFATMTALTFRWAIHGNVLPNISYATFLDIYSVATFLVVFISIAWNGCFVLIHRENKDHAVLSDRYALIVLALIVIIIHVVHLIWFRIAVKKRRELVELDKSASLTNLGNSALRSLSFKNKKGEGDLRNSSKININPKITKKTLRIMYSYVSLKDNAVVKIHHKTDNEIKDKIIEETSLNEIDESLSIKSNESIETEMPSNKNSNFEKRKTILERTKKSIRISDDDATILA